MEIQSSLIKKFINPVLNKLINEGCVIFGDKKIKRTFEGNILNAKEKSWSKEYLSAKVSVKSVKSVIDAVTDEWDKFHEPMFVPLNFQNKFEGWIALEEIFRKE